MEKKKIGIWIFLGITIFLVLAVWLTVSNTITGSATAGSLLNKILGIQTTPAAETSESGTGAVIPSEDVTYQGVLNMLKACRLELNNKTNYTCSNFCQQKSKTCIQAYSYNKQTQAIIPTSCSIKLGLSRILFCNCCSASTSDGEIYQDEGGSCTIDEDDSPYYPCRNQGSGNIACTCPGVGGAAFW